MLRHCIECGKQISSTLKDKCIHCKGNPWGVKCQLCGLILPQSEALNSGYTTKVYYHSKCIEDFKMNYLGLEGIGWDCPECHKDLMNLVNPNGLLDSSLSSSNTRMYPPYTCPYCGYEVKEKRNELFDEKGKCKKCELPVIPKLHNYCEQLSYYWYDGKPNHSFSHYYHHPLCSAGIKVDPKYIYR